MNCTVCTTEKKRQFLDSLCETGNVSAAAKLHGLPRRSLYAARAADPAFAADWETALEIGIDRLEDEAVRRAVEGYEEAVFQGGLCIGSMRKYSDLLLIFLLKSRRPQRYGNFSRGPITTIDTAAPDTASLATIAPRRNQPPA